MAVMPIMLVMAAVIAVMTFIAIPLTFMTFAAEAQFEVIALR